MSIYPKTACHSIFNLDGHIVEDDENMKMVVNRFLVSGITMKEVSAKMDVSVKNLQKLLKS